MRKILETCPTCDSNLIITELHCDTCNTVVRSRYAPCPFCALSDEQQTFLLLFVRSRGNLKDVEKTLGVSYPTVRAKLDEIIERLEPSPPVMPDGRSAVLAMVQSGQLGVDEALAQLRQSTATPVPTGSATEEYNG